MTTTLQILSFLSFVLGVVCYSISQLQQHGKLKWSKKGLGFWDFDSDKRKYISKIPFAKTVLVFLTDGYHLCQFCFFLFISLSFSIALQLENWKQYLLVYIGIHLVHFVTYKLLQK